MLTNIKPFLLDQLRHAVRVAATEPRFVSGQQPALKVGEALRPTDSPEVRLGIVLALHEACLLEAQRADLRHEAHATYVATFPEVGAFRCEFRTLGNTASFCVFPEPEERALVEPAREAAPPSLGAAGTPDPAEG